MTPTIAVVLPARERVDLLDTMLKSLVATAADASAIEVVVRADLDDAWMREYLRTGGWALPRLRFLFGPPSGGYATVPALINEAARATTAPLVLVVNDDAEFVTPQWDVLLTAAATKLWHGIFPDGLFSLGVDTAFNADHFPFPCVTRRLIEVLGYVFDERLIYPDIWLRDVLAPSGRAIRVPITVRHNWRGPSLDQQRAAHWTWADADYQARYTRCVEDGRATLQLALEEAL